MQVLALSSENQFGFTCPIFDAPTKMRACVKLRDLFMRGERPSVRRGCQACMMSGKCPALEVVRRFAFNCATGEDDLASTTETHGKLPASVLEKIAPIVVLPGTLNAYRVSDVERQMIETARERIDAQLRTAPRGERSTRITRTANQPERKPSRIKVPDAPASSTITTAAATGDLSAAINN